MDGLALALMVVGTLVGAVALLRVRLERRSRDQSVLAVASAQVDTAVGDSAAEMAATEDAVAAGSR